MPLTNLDGIRPRNLNEGARIRKKLKPKAFFSTPKVETILRPKTYIYRAGTGTGFFGANYRVAVAASVLILVLAFSSGVWAALSTPKTTAEIKEEETAVTLANKAPIPLAVLPPGSSAVPAEITNNVLFSMPLDQLENVFTQQQQAKQEKFNQDLLNSRILKIKNYLAGKKSPFADFADTIAKQPHWRLILAIAFAESSWGKNCVDNNCSNIGVKPGHELWHKYPSYAEWVIDFNKLLERRYKNSSLDDMCGVYVKPCNPNWLMATRSVLEEIKEIN